MSGLTVQLAAWLLTYALHSTLLLAAAALLTARWVRAEAWRETLWKAAIVGGLVTATVQAVSGYRSPAGRLELPVPAADAAASPAPPSAAGTAPIRAAEGAERESAAPTPTPATARPAADAPPAATQPSPARRPSAATLALAAWALLSAALVARLAWRQARLGRMLHGRERVTDGALARTLAELRRNAGIWRPVALTVSAAAPTPLALGGREICVPPRFLTDLDPEQQRSALAHELAHLARRDPAWHFAIGILQAVFFFQPLNRLARVRLRESAEFLCDEWAARQTGSPLGLARCLAEVASWITPGRSPIPQGTLAMAEGGSPLVQRVQRLTAWRGEGPQASGALRLAGAVLLVAGVAAAAPAVASAERDGATPASAADEVRGGRTDAVQPLIIPHPRPADPLPSRWTWALEQVAERRLDGAWIAWSVPTLLADSEGWISDSRGSDLQDLRRASLGHVLGAPDGHGVVLLSVTGDGRVRRVAVRRAAGMDLDQPVVWLGPADGAQTFAQLRALADGMGDAGLRATLVESIGILPADGVAPYLAGVLGRDGSAGVRREAAGVLDRHPGTQALAALVAAVERDGSPEVRREAVEAMGRMGTAESAAALREIAVSAPDPRTRGHAAEALGSGGPGALGTLRAIALGEDDLDAARQATESLERFDAGQAVGVLREAAWMRGRTEVARQAAESLGRFPADVAVALLDSLARRHPEAEVARQAVESLAGYPLSVTGRMLADIARTHPDPRVREEAREQRAVARALRTATEGAPPGVMRFDAAALAELEAAAETDVYADARAADADPDLAVDAGAEAAPPGE